MQQKMEYVFVNISLYTLLPLQLFLDYDTHSTCCRTTWPRTVLVSEHASSDLERLLVLKKGVFEVAFLSVHHTNIVVRRGHVRR